MDKKPTLVYELKDGTRYTLPFNTDRAVNSHLLEIWKKPEGKSGRLMTFNLPFTNGPEFINHNEIVGIESDDWSAFAESAYPYIRNAVGVYRQAETKRIQELVAYLVSRVDDLFSLGRITQPELTILTGTHMEGMEKPIIHELMQLFNDICVEDGHLDSWRFKIMREARKDCRVTSIYNGFKDGDKICMVVIHWKDFSVQFQLHQNQTYMRVTMPLASEQKTAE